MKVHEHRIMRRAVEDGVADGWHQAHKYDETPTPEHVRSCVEDAVIGALCEAFSFAQPDAEEDLDERDGCE